MTLASSYTMLFVGPEAVCFVKKKKRRKKEDEFLHVDFLCCCFCINVLLFSACCNFGVVTGCDSHRASSCHVKKKKKLSLCPKIFLFLKKSNISLG